MEENTILINDIARWIKNERINQGLSQKDLALKSNVSKSIIVRLENGGLPNITNSISLFNGLGYDMSLRNGKIYATRKE